MRPLYFFKPDEYQLSLSVNDVLVFLQERGLDEAAKELTEKANKAEKLLDKKKAEKFSYTSKWELNPEFKDSEIKTPGTEKKWYQKLFS